MAMQMKLQMKMTQQLIMTPQLQQAIKLLQLSRAELEELIEQSLIENPVLEEGMDIDTFPNETEKDLSTEQTEVPVSEDTYETAREEEKEEKIAEDEMDWQNYVEQVDQYSSYADRRVRSNGDDDELPSLEATLAQDESLQDHLAWQLGMLQITELEHDIALQLIGNIAESGYLVTSIREILERNPDLHERILDALHRQEIRVEHALDSYWMELYYQQEKVLPADSKRKSKRNKKNLPPPVFEEDLVEAEPSDAIEVSAEVSAFVESVLNRIQEFDPNGVGARSLQECLLVQLRILGKAHELSYRIIEQDMDLLESKDLKRIARRQKQELEKVLDAYRDIMNLEPKPGRSFTPPPSHHYIVPDVFIYQVNNEYKVALNAQGLPRLRISSYYRELSDNMEEDGNLTKEYIQEKIKSGQWLMKSIEQRQKTIYKVTKSILRFQRSFFDKGIHYLKPLVLKDVAEDIDVHESTVSRITTNKYVHTPQGIFELKYFFTSGIDQEQGEAVSSKRIKDMIQQMVQNENVRSPYTDLQIADILQKRSGIKVARRTVAKYREALNILPSNKRKQLF
jgi:RNA polymerase sigma-54 factor